MKKQKLMILSALALTAVFSGCSLDEYNPSNISTGQAWSTPSGYEKKINDCYFDLVRIIYGQAEDTYMIVSEGGTDIWQDTNPQGNNGDWSKLMRYEDFGASCGMVKEGYSGFYGVVNACNGAIQFASKVQGMSQADVNALVAEAHFIRAHALFNIVEQWGGKYLPLKPLDKPLAVLECSSVNDFYKVIISDLEFAMANLPMAQKVRGRVTRAAAYHLYAKACLSYSTYTDGLGNTTALTGAESNDLLLKAKTAADYLIDNAASFGVEAYEDVNEVFDEYNNKTNREALFIVTHSTIQAYNPRGNYYNRAWKHSEAYDNNTSGIYLGGMSPSYDTEVGGYDVPKLAKGNCIMEPSKYMIDLYGDKDMRYKAFFKDTYYVNKATNEAGNGYTWDEPDAARYGLSATRVGNKAFDITLGDTAVYISRKTYTQAERDACRYAICNIEDNYADPKVPNKFFPSLKKMDCPSLYCGSNANKPYSAADCIIYRLGETYLLSAEINWRLGDTQAAAGRLNFVRNRACQGHDHCMDVTPQQVTQDLLLDEYAREMVGEWSRWTTLKRFRAIEGRLDKANRQVVKFDKSIHYLRPIPTAELLLIDNPGEYQNPGY